MRLLAESFATSDHTISHREVNTMQSVMSLHQSLRATKKNEVHRLATCERTVHS